MANVGWVKGRAARSHAFLKPTQAGRSLLGAEGMLGTFNVFQLPQSHLFAFKLVHDKTLHVLLYHIATLVSLIASTYHTPWSTSKLNLTKLWLSSRLCHLMVRSNLHRMTSSL